jgi:hypothetical protein
MPHGKLAMPGMYIVPKILDDCPYRIEIWPRFHTEGVRELASILHGVSGYGKKGPSFPVGETIVEDSEDFSVSEQILLTIGNVVNSGQTATVPTLSRGTVSPNQCKGASRYIQRSQYQNTIRKDWDLREGEQ